MNTNYLVVIFKNKTKRKIINRFKTYKRAIDFFEKMVKESNDVVFEKLFDNGFESNYELALLEKISGTFIPIFIKDDLGRQIKIELDDNDYYIPKIVKYKIPELIHDYESKQKISFSEFLKIYLKKGDGFKMISKLNNKIILQNDDDYKIFTLKNDFDSSRFIDCLVSHFQQEKRSDCIFVKDSSTIQRKYLYSILVEKGFPKDYLFRQKTTHAPKT